MVGFLGLLALILIAYPSSSSHWTNVTRIDTYYVNTNMSMTGTHFEGSVSGFETASGASYLETVYINVGSSFPTEKFTSIKTNTTGFSIISVSPSLPIKVNGGQSQQLTLQIKTPSSNYTGPLSIIEYYNAPKPKYVNVSQVNFFSHNVTANRTYFAIALYGFNTTAGSSYLYSFGISNGINTTRLSFATNTTGFTILNVTPSLPLKLTSNSQTFTLRIQTPNSNYAGPLSVIGYYK